MNPDQLNHELIFRHLDGRLSPEQQAEFAQLLRVDASARAYLREVAEQAVMVAELERTAACRELTLESSKPSGRNQPTKTPRTSSMRFRTDGLPKKRSPRSVPRTPVSRTLAESTRSTVHPSGDPARCSFLVSAAVLPAGIDRRTRPPIRSNIGCTARSEADSRSSKVL